MKELIFKSILFLHVLAGGLALIVGLIAMLNRKKGNKLHKRTGIIFYWCMNFIFLTAILFVAFYPEQEKYWFFLTIGIVSFYPNFTGVRILKMKKGIEARWFDYAALVMIIISGFIMLKVGLGSLLGFDTRTQFEILYLVFGIFSLIQGYGDSLVFIGIKKAEKLHWLYGHAGKMIGSYSAALTAFCVNIIPRYLPSHTPFFVYILIWVGPGVLLGIYSVRKIKALKSNPKLAMR